MILLSFPAESSESSESSESEITRLIQLIQLIKCLVDVYTFCARTQRLAKFWLEYTNNSLRRRSRLE